MRPNYVKRFDRAYKIKTPTAGIVGDTGKVLPHFVSLTRDN